MKLGTLLKLLLQHLDCGRFKLFEGDRVTCNATKSYRSFPLPPCVSAPVWVPKTVLAKSPLETP